VATSNLFGRLMAALITGQPSSLEDLLIAQNNRLIGNWNRCDGWSFVTCKPRFSESTKVLNTDGPARRLLAHRISSRHKSEWGTRSAEHGVPQIRSSKIGMHGLLIRLGFWTRARTTRTDSKLFLK
jgi:hypothetical protein